MVAWQLCLFLGSAFARVAVAAAGDVCYIFGANTVLLDDQLFFMSGNYSIVTYAGQDITPTASLYSLDMTVDFPVERTIPQSSLHNRTISSEYATAYTNSLNGNNPGGSLWYTNDTIYPFAGVDGQSNTLSAYSIKSSTWEDVSVAGGNFNFGNRSNALSVSDPNSGLSFALGGISPYMGSSMLRFDASDPKSLSWTNETLGNGSSGIEVPNLESGTMIYLPAGEQGVLLAFGGGNISAGISPDSGWPNPSDYSVINVYDIASHTWWAQEASAASSSAIPPEYLVQTCAGMTSSPDNSAFHITLYGGWSLLEQRSFETVYILSIPSFTWIDATDASYNTNKEQQNETIGRDTPSCQIYNGAQLISFGGDIRFGRSSLLNGACSQVFSPVRALDLSTYQWQYSFDPSIEYKVPEVIYDVIGGNATGGATKTFPSGGWANPTLASVLNRRVFTATTTSTSTPTSTPASTLASTPASGSPSTTAPSSEPNPSHTNIGTIAGAAVGSVAALALLAGAALFRRRRSSRTKHRSAADYDDKAFNTPTSPHELDERHLVEMPGEAKPMEADTTPLYEMAAKSGARSEPSELPGEDQERRP